MSALGSVAIGLIAALMVIAPQGLRVGVGSIPWTAPLLILAAALIAMALQRFYWDRLGVLKRYDGLSDLLVHVHSPGETDSPLRWVSRGALSFLIALSGGAVGPEGAATEVAHAASMQGRPSSARWSEQRRRTDAATAVAAGVAAAFGAPFAGVLAAVEMGLGGRVLSVALGALTAYLAVRGASVILPMGQGGLHTFDLSSSILVFPLEDWRAWAATACIILLGSLLALVALGVIRYAKNGFSGLFQSRAWLAPATGGVLLFLLAVAYASGHAPPSDVLENLLWSRQPVSEAGLILCVQLLALAFTLAAFGTSGVFWPVLALGGVMGLGIDQWMFGGVPGFAIVSSMIGGAALFGGVLGMPLAGSVLVFELTGHADVLLPCLVAGFAAHRLREHFGILPLVSRDLKSRGIQLIDGRSSDVLGALSVAEAMVSDHETAHEREAVTDLHERLARSRYPFLPVVSDQGVYLGLLTADMIQDSWQSEDPMSSHQPLQKLLEAKDLLYRSQRSAKRVKPLRRTDRLSTASMQFGDSPCLPVLGEDGSVVGLLFAYSVRLAYEREVSRRALALQHQRR